MSSCLLYQKNLAVLRSRHPHIAHKIQSHPLPAFFQKKVFSTDSLQYRSLASSVMNSVNQGMDFLYLLQLGDGQVLSYCAPEITAKNRGVLVVEPNRERFELALGKNDFCNLFENLRIFWAIGNGVKEQIEEIWKHSYCFLAEKAMMHSGELPATPEAQKRNQELVPWIKKESHRRKKQYQQMVKNLPDDLANHQRSDSRGRIWCYLDLRQKAGYTLIQHVLIRTIMYYLRKLGFETKYTALQHGEYYPPYYRHYQLAEFKPDLIFLCNDSPAFESGLGAEYSRSLPIPKVTWFADDPIHGEHLFQRHGVSEDESFLVADTGWRDPIVENGCEREIPYLPGAATKTRRGKKRGTRKCEIVFVGQVRDQRQFFAKLPPAWKNYCNQVIGEKLRFPRLKIREVMNKYPMPGELPQDRLDEFRQKVLWEANTRFRVQVIRQLAKFDLRVYGNSDWLRLLPEEITTRCFKGILRFQHLFEVYRNAKITLNIHSLQSYTCLNVRDFDVPAAGGFLISDWLPHADEVFTPGFVNDLPLEKDSKCEMFFYRSVQELETLVEYFLRHEDKRVAVGERAREKVITEHTYKQRAEWLAGFFDNKIADFQNKKGMES